MVVSMKLFKSSPWFSIPCFVFLSFEKVSINKSFKKFRRKEMEEGFIARDDPTLTPLPSTYFNESN